MYSLYDYLVDIFRRQPKKKDSSIASFGSKLKNVINKDMFNKQSGLFILIQTDFLYFASFLAHQSRRLRVSY
jgi:hypothetical protein